LGAIYAFLGGFYVHIMCGIFVCTLVAHVPLRHAHATNSISHPYSTNSVLRSGWRSHTCVHPHITNISKTQRVIRDVSRTLYYSRVGVVIRCLVQNTTLVSCLAACRLSCLVYVTHTHMHTHTHTHMYVYKDICISIYSINEYIEICISIYLINTCVCLWPMYINTYMCVFVALCLAACRPSCLLYVTHAHTHTHTHVRTQAGARAHARRRTRAHTHTNQQKDTRTKNHTHKQSHTYTHTHTHAHMCRSIYVITYAYICISINSCVCLFVVSCLDACRPPCLVYVTHTHTRTHTHTHTHTYVHKCICISICAYQ